MSILTIINNWRLIAIAGATTAFAVLIALFKRRGEKIEELEHEITIKDKKAEITESQEEFKATHLSNEQDEILKELDSNAEKNRNDRVNRL